MKTFAIAAAGFRQKQLNGRHHAISLNNGRKHTTMIRNVSDLGFWSLFLSRLLNLKGTGSFLQLYMNFSRLNWVGS